ncbi:MULTISPECIES: hypothetical protein [Streptomyces]|uniref:hypothetical protein n=1 Tax=Streptomyces TaxID=1883 RepID=UPI001E37EBDD|nr:MULTISPECIES: hypothetical protein [Streptomyces]UFQ16420.1 hypothetical protein J2N69_16205 [Streptomyces huasconensis]WCL86023.1 hypothetical protein PPN52_16210 [Streptomyces sp. JCM 35825]
MEPDNRVLVWDGTSWVQGKLHFYAGAWADQLLWARFWDGDTWRYRAPDPLPYPAHVGSISGLYGVRDYVDLPVPKEARVLDFVVSICASSGARPQLVSPGGFVAQSHQLSSGNWLSVVVWPYDGRGGNVVWDVRGTTNSTAMNLAYRGGDLSSTPIAPIKEIKQYSGVNRVPLNSPVGFTSVFLVLTESTNLTGYSLPEGVIYRSHMLGKFGSLHISLVASDTPGTGSSAGEVVLDTTVDSAACVTIQIPGASDGKPTWVLGDAIASKLGTTTVLG